MGVDSCSENLTSMVEPATARQSALNADIISLDVTETGNPSRCWFDDPDNRQQGVRSLENHTYCKCVAPVKCFTATPLNDTQNISFSSNLDQSADNDFPELPDYCVPSSTIRCFLNEICGDRINTNARNKSSDVNFLDPSAFLKSDTATVNVSSDHIYCKTSNVEITGNKDEPNITGRLSHNASVLHVSNHSYCYTNIQGENADGHLINIDDDVVDIRGNMHQVYDVNNTVSCNRSYINFIESIPMFVCCSCDRFRFLFKEQTYRCPISNISLLLSINDILCSFCYTSLKKTGFSYRSREGNSLDAGLVPRNYKTSI